jgi:hypothetical protein
MAWVISRKITKATLINIFGNQKIAFRLYQKQTPTMSTADLHNAKATV